jgi:hypothetical protein|tara:strand:+ start:297 stop:689 length:393 start_codon:yes stop_codon:yes gene_type:complete
MSWKDILKNETPIEDLISDVDGWLDEFLNSELVISEDYDEEFEGYRNASKFSLYIDYPNGEIKISPADTHEEDDDITISYEIDYVGGKGGLRIGSYTGEDGHYIASHDWEENDREDLTELYNMLASRKGL